MRKTKPLKDDADYQRIWSIVDGAIRDTMRMHPEYMRIRDRTTARISINKRVTGALVGELRQRRGDGRKAV